MFANEEANTGVFWATLEIAIWRAMRVLGADPELECDLAVAASGLHPVVDDPTAVGLPPTAVAPAWAGVSPPRAGWKPAVSGGFRHEKLRMRHFYLVN